MVASRWVVGLLGSVIFLAGTERATAQERLQTPRILTPSILAQSTELTEADRLFDEGWAFFGEGTAESFQQAIALWQEALSLYEQHNNQEEIALTTLALGFLHNNLGDRQAALIYYKQSLSAYRTLGDPSGEISTLMNIGAVYSAIGQEQAALDYLQEALLLSRAVGDRRSEASILNNIAFAYYALGDQQALDYYEQALLLLRAVGDVEGEATTLSNIGVIYDDFGEQQQALDYYQQALSLFQTVGDRAGEASTLSNIALVYSGLGEQQRALEIYQQALALLQTVGDRPGEAIALSNIGVVYNSLGQPERALDYYQQALPIFQAVGDQSGEATTLSNLGNVLFALERQAEALEHYRQALAVAEDTDDPRNEATVLNNIGFVYYDLDEQQQALDYFQRALSLITKLGDRRTEATTLNNLGLVYFALDNKPQALNYYQQALPLTQMIGDRSTEALVLNNLGSLFRDLAQPEIAIIFYKQSVNVYESLRGEITGLELDIQQTYTDSVAETYRRLANVLLAQDRILEAQRVLDLLKVQELDDYLNNVRGNSDTETGIANRTAESLIIDGYNVLLDDAIQVGQSLAELSQIPVGERTAEQRDQIRTLRQAREEITVEISEFFESEPVQAELAKLQRNTGGESIDLDLYAKNLRDDLQQLDNAVILYPLVLGDRLELIVISATAPPFRRTVPLSRVELNQAILDYRHALTRPQLRRNLDEVQAASKTLYDALIAPIAKDLEDLGTENIIYAPDGQLRYVPLSALYDGNQWLIENYAVNNITAVSLTNFTDKPSDELAVLAGAFTDSESSVTVGTRNFSFDSLPYAQSEVEILAQTLPTATTRLGKDFNADIRFEVEDYNVVHLATHAKFVSGTPEESFILFNNQEKQTLKDVEKWDLTNVDLLVLSACQTALGDELGDGKEILGLGFQMQRAGAKSTIASLWSVDDGGTQVLMNYFYAVLANEPNITKAEALRKAQIALAQNIDPITGEPIENSLGRNLNHPYYWSPFILIGNGL